MARNREVKVVHRRVGGHWKPPLYSHCWPGAAIKSDRLIGLDGVRQRVHTGRGRDLWWQLLEDLGVEDGHVRHKAQVYDGDLLLLVTASKSKGNKVYYFFW